MNFSFGIISNGENYNYLNKCIASINTQKIKNSEIIIVGSIEKEKIIDNKNINFINFDETIKPGWITKKKNLITENSKFENIVYMHDYLMLHKYWFKGYSRFGNNFEIVMNKMLNPDNTRYRDWTLWPHNDSFVDKVLSDNECLLPYSVTNLTKYMYISGAYWVAKKYVMEEFPLNEDLSWGEGEDVEWSKRVRDKYLFKFNKYSKTQLQKHKNPQFKNISRKQLKIINSKI
tara:strand:+ start:31238 stop:31933 length:696 start_codon:yes stop_codon:yes gene_type:complete